MTIVGRLTKDAVVNTLKDERKVINFCIAVNERFPSRKGGERVKRTSYFNCAYWRGEGVAEYLKKGTLVQVEGRVFASAYVGNDGTAKASLNCHVNNLKLHASPKEVALIGRAVTERGSEETKADDIPF